MGDFLILKIGAVERLLFSNSLGDWPVAGGVAVAVALQNVLGDLSASLSITLDR